MCGKRPVEVTGPEALRIAVDSDHGMQRRIFAPLAEYCTIDVAFGADDRPAVLFGQHHARYLGSYPHTPTQPHALQKSQPSLLISAELPHSGHFTPFIFGAAPGEGELSTPMACTG